MADPLLQQVIDGTQVNPDYSFIDADTIRHTDGKSYRLQGFDAPELAKWVGDKAKLGTAGGYEATQAIQRLAAKEGYTNVEILPDHAAFGRGTAILTNDKGESFTTRLIESGVLEAGAYTTEQDLQALRVAELFGDQIKKEGDESFSQAADEVQSALLKDGYDNLNFKEQALNEMHYAAAPSQYSANIAYRAPDRDIKGNALNPISEAWDTGLDAVVESGYGFAALLGDSTGIEGLKNLGDQGVARARGRIADNAKFITDYKDVNSFGDAFEFLGTNLAMSLPYMGLTVAGAVAAPLTGLSVAGAAAGAVALSPAAAYAGQIWNEQTEKNASYALAGGVVQAAIDRLGLGLLVKGGPSKEVFEQGVQALIKNGATREAAEATLSNATRLELAKAAGDAAKIASDQLAKKKVAMDLAKRAAGGVATEGSTEALQELIGYTAANAHTNTWDWGDVQERLIAASIAGGALGGGFATAGSLANTAAWADVAVRQAPADTRRLSQAGRYAEQERELNGYVPTIQELTAQNRAAPAAFNTLESRSQRHGKTKSEKSLSDQLTDIVSSAPSLWRGATRWIFKPEIQAQSRSARILADMFGGNLQRTYSGSNFENYKHHKISKYKNMIELPQKFWQVMNGGKKANAKRRGEISREVYAQLQAAHVDGKFDPNLIPDGPQKQYILQFQAQLKRLGDQLYEDQRQFNPDLGYIDNYLGRYKAFDKAAINNDKVGFVQNLVKKFGMTEAEAKQITDNILGNNEINDIDEAFSVTRGTPVPGAHKKRSLNLSEQAEFQKYMQQDIFQNISTAAKAATRFQAYQEFVGKDGEQIAKLLDKMEAEGVPQDQVDQIAKQIQDYLDAESGNYKRPTTEFGKTLEKVQKNFMFLTMFAGLGLSTISSFVELALTTKGLTRQQIKDVQGLARNMGGEIWNTMGQGLKEVANLPVGQQLVHNRTAAKNTLQDLGFYEWDVGAATTTGVSEIDPWKQRWTEMFFKANGLQGYTQMTRAIRASFAGDFMSNHLDTIAAQGTGPKTNEIQEAEEALRTIGLDPHRFLEVREALMLGTATPEQEAWAADQVREATFNFINEAVALPQAQNRPLIFQDPRFALFTQFQGFISTFTANHIPKLWGEYVKRGTPAMKYQAFAMMATMIALGFISQDLKDRLKYGGPTPYLDDDEYIRRGIFSSGLFGTSERVIDTFFPLYEQRSDNVAEWVFNETTGQSPALSNVTTVAGAGGDLITGDVGRAAKGIARVTPFLAPLSQYRNQLGDFLSEWNFDGGDNE